MVYVTRLQLPVSGFSEHTFSGGAGHSSGGTHFVSDGSEVSGMRPGGHVQPSSQK